MSSNKRRTVLGQTHNPRCASSELMSRKRLPVHRPRLPIGSPAVSSRNKVRSRFKISGVFFPLSGGRLPPVDPSAQHLAAEQLALSAGDGVHIQTKVLRRSSLAAIAVL